jgi:N-hydroxyarylamine O-acetyltransferase
MQIADYLDRIGYQGSPEATAATVDQLIALHQGSVPFENIDIVRLHRPIVLDRARLYEKIVSERRGGFCYELNGAFSWLLEALGARVTYGYGSWQVESGEWVEPFQHIVLAVELPGEGGRRLVDVGFGADSPICSAPLRDGAETTVTHPSVRGYRTIELNSGPDAWRIERLTPEGIWTLVYEVDLTPRALSDFNSQCQELQTSPESHFTQQLICSRATPTGRVTIGGGRFIHTVDGDRTEREINGLDDELALLQEWFDIRIDATVYGGQR